MSTTTTIAKEFPAETRYLTWRAALQLTAINMHIADMTKTGYSISADDLGVILLQSLAIRAKSLSERIGKFSDSEEFRDPYSELVDACQDIEGVLPQHVDLASSTREYYGIGEDSPIGQEHYEWPGCLSLTHGQVDGDGAIQ